MKTTVLSGTPHKVCLGSLEVDLRNKPEKMVIGWFSFKLFLNV